MVLGAVKSGVGSAANSWPKWSIGIILAAVGTLGFGYWYLKRKNAKWDCKNYEHDITTNSVDVCVAQKKSEIVYKEKTPLELAQDLKNSGNVFFKANNYEDALRCYTEAIELCPVDQTTQLAMFYQNRAATNERLGKSEAVRSDLDAAIRLNPVYVKALQRRVKVLEETGDILGAFHDVTAICVLEAFQEQTTIANADRILNEIGRIYGKEAMANRQPVLSSKHFIETYLSAFNEDPIRSSLQMTNGFTDSAELKGLARAKQALCDKEYDAIVAACTEEIEATPLQLDSNSVQSVEARLLRATFYILSGMNGPAMEDLNVICSHAANNPKIAANALIKRATLHFQMGEGEECFADFVTAKQHDPNNADIYHHLGQVYLLMNRVAEATSEFREAVAKAPDFPMNAVHLYYSEFKAAASETERSAALAGLQEIIRLNPTCIEAYTVFAQVMAELHQFERADDLFNAALEKDPQNADLRVHRGLLLLQWKGEIDKTVEMLNEAIRLDNRCVLGLETLATIEVQRGNYEEAVKLYEKAMPFAKSEMEMAHIVSLKYAAEAQLALTKRLGIKTMDMTRRMMS